MAYLLIWNSVKIIWSSRDHKWPKKERKEIPPHSLQLFLLFACYPSGFLDRGQRSSSTGYSDFCHPVFRQELSILKAPRISSKTLWALSVNFHRQLLDCHYNYQRHYPTDGRSQEVNGKGRRGYFGFCLIGEKRRILWRHFDSLIAQTPMFRAMLFGEKIPFSLPASKISISLFFPL